MSAEVPDPRNLQSWEEAFNKYPIPTVRGLEKKLRSNLTESHDKLRTLVGASYRDLLGTARTIIDMDDQLHQVETLLGASSRKTNSRQVEKIGGNYARYQGLVTAGQQQRYSIAAQYHTLGSCLDVAGKMLRAGGSALLTAKLIVISRLLHKSLSDHRDSIGLANTLAKKLRLIRLKLLRYVDRQLVVHHSDNSHLVQDLAAFSLATSSSPTDSLAHFYHLRTTAIGKDRDASKQSIKESVLGRLELFLATLRQSRSVFPSLLSASLKTLSVQPLLADQSILAIDELKLDVHARWFDSSTVNYTPWTRHDELRSADAEEKLRAWATQGFDLLVTMIEQDIATETDFTALSVTRKDILQTWLSNRNATRGLDRRMTLQKLRAPLVKRYQVLVDDSCTQFKESLSTAVFGHARAEGADDTTPANIWKASDMINDLSDGAQSFRTSLLSHRTGNTTTVTAILDEYTKAVAFVSQVQSVTKNMYDTRWDDDFDDSDSDEDAGDSFFDALSRDDPTQIQTNLRKSVVKTIQDLEGALVSNYKARASKASLDTAEDVSLLRILRELRQRLFQILQSLDSTAAGATFSQSIVTGIHQSIASAAVKSLDTVALNSMDKFTSSPLHIRGVWAGNPPLPVQCTPGTFRILRTIVKNMDAMGMDIWTPDLVTVLKSQVAGQLSGLLSKAVTTVERQNKQAAASGEPQFLDTNVQVKKEPEEEQVSQNESKDESPADQAPDAPQKETPDSATNGNAEKREPETESSSDLPSSPSDSEAQDKLIQLLFDTLYLQQALKIPRPARGEPTVMLAPIQELTAKSGLDTAAEARLQKSAKDYWRKTYLLFGLLAGQ